MSGGVAGFGDAAAWLLAVSFGWAGISKLVSRRRTVAGFAALGIPVPTVIAPAVALTEVGAASALVLVPPLGALGAMFLLVVFTGVLLDVERRGVTVPCACFGATSSRPVGIADVVRNIGLLGASIVAALAASGPGPVLPPAEATGTVLLGAGVWWLFARRIAGVTSRGS